MPVSKDSDLVHRAQTGDRNAFDALCRSHYSRIFNLIAARTGPDDAEDLAQVTFLRAYENVGGFRGDASFLTWLTRIALNVCNSHWQDRQARMNRFDPLEDPEYVPGLDRPQAQVETPENHMHRKECQNLVMESIRNLPEQHRNAMWLRYVQGHTYEEITRTLRVPIGTVKTWLFRGRLALQGELRRLGVYA